MMSMPATYQDLIQAGLVFRGKNPAEVIGKSKPGAALPMQRLASPVTVKGGELTPQIEMVARAWSRQAMPKHWAKRNGSSPDGIKWLLSQAEV